jgi:hypothetical protein
MDLNHRMPEDGRQFYELLHYRSATDAWGDRPESNRNHQVHRLMCKPLHHDHRAQ